MSIDNTINHRFQCRKWVGGAASGKAIVARERLSFWGGFDPQTGLIVDPYSELRGRDITNCVLVILSSKGSSGTSGMLSLARRAGHAPAAMIHLEIDAVAVMGCLANKIPLLQPVEFDPFREIQDGNWVDVDGDQGTITISDPVR